MHIKQLTVHGFKSYRDETVFGPFSAGHNVIVGRNGSGKSNFFAAIRFVLHDAYARLGGSEERQALLHDGANVSAYVELVLDNSDQRFPTGRPEVRIRRTVGVKKDEYSVDERAVAKGEVQRMLQTAGFSPSNPYYIVPQGRVTALTNARDEERLAVLKEVAGTRTYEEHRAESLRILEETRGKRERIGELLSYISSRLGDLQQEKEALQHWQHLERRRRTLQRKVYSGELALIDNELMETDAQVGSTDESEPTDDTQLCRIEELETRLISTRASLEETEAELSDVIDDSMRLKEDSIAADRKVAQLAPALSRMEAQEAEARSELAELDIIIGEKETRLFILSDELITFNKEMNQLAKIFDEKRDEIKRIATQRARTCQFRSAGERDKWIRKEIQVMQNTLEGNKKHLESLNEEAHSLRIRLEDLSKAERENSNISDPSKDKKSIRVLQEERRELWRTENKLTASLVTVRQQLLSSEKTLAAAGDGGRSVAALSAVRRLANSMNLGDKVYGALYELITPRDSVLNAAIDAAAGSALMHCIVDNAQTAALLMEALSKEKSGRLTFCPLDRLSDNYRENEFKEAGDYLENNFMIDDEKAVKLIDQIDFDESVRPAIEAVFGRILVIRDLSDAAVARAAGWTCVTVDGDRADRSGAISSSGTGSHGRMEAAARYTHWSRKTVEHETLLKQVKNRLSEVDRLLASSISSAVQKTDEQSQTTIFEEVKLSLDAKEAAILSLSNDSLSIEREIKSLESEIGTLLGEAMSEINLTIDDSELVLMAQKVREIKAEMAEIESQLEEKLRRRKRHLVRWLLDGPDEVRQEYQEALEKVETSKAALKIAEAESLRLSETRSKAEQESLLISQALDLARSAHDEALKHKLHSSGPKERILAKRTALIAEREALVRRIAAIPLDFIVLNSNCNTMTISNEAEESEEVSEIAEDLPEETLLKLLHQVNDRIKKECQHVNKKAYEQHAAFERQGNLLEKRKDELEKSASSINDFIGVLDRRKDEAIERTFSTVATAFSEIFAALTSGGSGELLIMRDFVSTDSTDIDDEITCDEKSDKNQTSKEARGKRGTKKNLQVQKQRITYTGISVRVSFSSKEGTLLTQQLSGGQKSLVALALIFAIQRCDPAPFYLFDEIDANLDAAHRTAVANLIHKMCSAGVDSSISLSSQDEESVCERIETAQFITTTFRPELLTNANAFFGVSFGGRVSRVESISREQALHFVEQDPVAC